MALRGHFSTWHPETGAAGSFLEHHTIHLPAQSWQLPNPHSTAFDRGVAARDSKGPWASCVKECPGEKGNVVSAERKKANISPFPFLGSERLAALLTHWLDEHVAHLAPGCLPPATDCCGVGAECLEVLVKDQREVKEG